MWRPDRQADELSAQQVRELEALERILGRATVDVALQDPHPDADAEHAPLARLVAVVRDDRLPLRPAFADELGLRVSAGFARRPGRRAADNSSTGGSGRARRARLRAVATSRPSRRQWLVGLGAAASVAGGAVVVAGGIVSTPSPVPPVVSAAQNPAGTVNRLPNGQLARSTPPQSTASQPTTGAAGANAPAAGGAASSTAPGASPGSSAPSIAPSPPATPALGLGGTRAVESDASLGLLAPHGQVQKVADETIAATDRLGGIVQSSTVTVGDQGGSQATLALAVPSAALARTLAALSSLAHVSSRSQNTLDITDSTQAARDRLSQSRAERLALLRELGRASTAGQIASINAQLGLVAGRIAQDEASLRTLVGRATTASVNVTIDEAGSSAGAAGGSGWAPTAALGDALDVLEAAFAVVVIGLAVVAPAGALGALAWYSARAVRRRLRQGALAA